MDCVLENLSARKVVLIQVLLRKNFFKLMAMISPSFCFSMTARTISTATMVVSDFKSAYAFCVVSMVGYKV